MTRITRVLAMAIVAVTAGLMSACSAGQLAQTSQMEPDIPGTDADAGPIALRDLLIPYRSGGYPTGSNVPLVVRMFSTDEQPVTVTGVAPGPGGPMTVGAEQFEVRGQPRSTDRSVTALTVPPDGDLLLVPGSGPYLVAVHVTAPIPYGAAVPVRFTFSAGGSIDVDVPMAPPDYPVTGQPAPSPSSGSPAPGATAG